jgi:hypothetical protein
MPVMTKKKVVQTPVPVRFGAEEAGLLKMLQARATAHDRSLSGQLKHYARLALIAEDNPDLPLSMIQGILEAQAEMKAGLGQPYQWGVLEPA